MIKYFALILAVSLLPGCHTAPSTAPLPALTGNYVLDPTHASVTWSISHAGLSNYTARIDKISGVLAYDATSPEDSQLDIRIDPASVNTGLPDFDKTIAFDSRYFDANAHPEIRFVATHITPLTETTGSLKGDLTFRGVTRPVSLDATFNGAGKSFGHPGQTLGFSAVGTLSRSEFGLTYLKNFGIGDEVTLRIETEFNEKQ